MRYITIPKDADTSLLLTTRDGKPLEAWPFVSGFFTSLVLPRMARETAADTEILVSVVGKLQGAKAGDVVELTDAEHEALAKALPKGQGDLQGELLMAVVHFFHAVTAASKEKPETKTSEASTNGATQNALS